MGIDGRMRGLSTDIAPPAPLRGWRTPDLPSSSPGEEKAVGLFSGHDADIPPVPVRKSSIKGDAPVPPPLRDNGLRGSLAVDTTQRSRKAGGRWRTASPTPSSTSQIGRRMPRFSFFREAMKDEVTRY
jgi:hypothetical protein